VLTFVVGTNPVQKTINELVEVSKPKGTQLVCRPG
jgi:hypothetical protein